MKTNNANAPLSSFNKQEIMKSEEMLNEMGMSDEEDYDDEDDSDGSEKLE